MEFNYQPKFTSGLLITNRADVNQNELFCPLVSANLYFFCCMIFQLDIMIMMYFFGWKEIDADSAEFQLHSTKIMEVSLIPCNLLIYKTNGWKLSGEKLLFAEALATE